MRIVLAAMVISLAVASADVGASDYPKLGREVVEIVRQNFLDIERAEVWASRHEDYGADIADVETFASRTNELLAELETSHTRYHPRGTVPYWGLLAIFSGYLEVERVEYDGIGADVSARRFVRRVLAGGPADEAGILRGDRIVTVDGRPYRAIDTFAGRAGERVTLTVERATDEVPLEIVVTPRRTAPMEE